MAEAPQGALVQGGRVRRFAPVSIAFHWMYAAAWLTLVITGLGFAFKELGFLMGSTARLIHRGAALVFVALPLVYVFVAWQPALFYLREVFTWTRDDWRWLAVMIPYHFTGRPEPPKQGFLNAGQKLNFLVVIFTNLLFATTGFIMWFVRPTLALAERDVFRWAATLHSASLWIAMAMFFVHVYMSGIHPFTRHAFRAMIDGTVSLRYALHEHPRWAEQFVPKGGSGKESR